MAEPQTVHLEPVELVAVNGEVAQPGIFPGELLVNFHTHQVRHHIGQAAVMIAFHPDHLYLTFGIRELADVTEEAPVFFGETPEIQVGENVAQQDQSLETIFLEHAGGIVRSAAVGAKVHVGEDQRVVDGRIHTSFLANGC